MREWILKYKWWLIIAAAFLIWKGDKAVMGDFRGIVADIRSIGAEVRQFIKELTTDEKK